MTIAQKVILGALLVAGALCLIVGFTLMHHIGGFMRTVEEEAREEEQRAADGGNGKNASSENSTEAGETQ